MDILEKVQNVLDEVRPMLQRDGGDVELVEITADNIVNVRLRGACGTCPGAIMTLKGGIERLMKQRVPEVVAVESVR
ncbi:Fe/S biogenesis protein NfuA [Candidatus Magnetaquicoccaceae bacterium FCR-1]|uniref:Fe/S biogenesis protein NfuA n=1 Tax=Candidatus Magnetaquiglobus chichijimensis TaxID=3141448 RepID=A0ABQ0C6K2_9PROT